jgi:hypothetical protein
MGATLASWMDATGRGSSSDPAQHAPHPVRNKDTEPDE